MSASSVTTNRAGGTMFDGYVPLEGAFDELYAAPSILRRSGAPWPRRSRPSEPRSFPAAASKPRG